MSFGLLVTIFLTLVFVLRIYERAWRRKRDKEAFGWRPSQLLGNAAFATDKDCKRAGLFSRKGILIGYAPKSGHVLRYGGDAMLTTIAPGGSGKGTVQIIANGLGLDDRSLIVFCPKGESPAVFGHHRAKLGPCFLLNPYEPEELKPYFKGLKTSGYNPMSLLTDPRESALNFNSNAGKIAEGCTFRESENAEAEFFSSAGRNLIHGVIMGVARHEPPQKRNLVRVAEIISSGEIYAWARKIVSITKDPFIRQKLGSFATGSEADRTLEGIRITASVNLSFLADDAIAKCVSFSDFRFRDLRERLSTVMITVPVTEMAANGGRFFKLLLSSMLADLLRPGRGKKRVLIIVDEAFSMGAVASLETAVGIARGFGVQIWTFWQDLSQLEARYPRSYQTFLSNSGVRTFMTPQDEKTANYVSAQIGITQVSDWQKSVNFDPMNNVKEGWSQPISARPLMHAYECRALPENQMFVFVRGIAGVIKARRIPYFERREFRGKARSDPYYQQKGLWRKILG